MIRAQAAFIIARICEEGLTKDSTGKVVRQAQKDIFNIFNQQTASGSVNGAVDKQITLTLPLFLIDQEGYQPNQARVRNC